MVHRSLSIYFSSGTTGTRSLQSVHRALPPLWKQVAGFEPLHHWEAPETLCLWELFNTKHKLQTSILKAGAPHIQLNNRRAWQLCWLSCCLTRSWTARVAEQMFQSRCQQAVVGGNHQSLPKAALPLELKPQRRHEITLLIWRLIMQTS